MISYEQALKLILGNLSTRPTEKILFEDSLGRILAEDIYSGLEMPPFNKSAMDGYALNSLDVQKVPVKLKCIGLIQAGENFKKAIKRGECVKIMTGSPLPENADSVVMVENTRQIRENVEVLEGVEKGENVCFQGEDIRRGEKVLKKGTKISAAHIALLATIGRNFIKVVRPPRVAILNTGGEIVPVGAKLGRSQIYNSNGPMLSVLLRSDGIEPYFLGIARDNEKELKQAIKQALGMDIILISGGVSMGDYDLVPEVLTGLGVKKIFHKVNIKPGKPLFWGIRRKTAIFGIPGNPVSNFLTYFVFIRPALFKMRGYKVSGPEFKQGFLAEELRLRGGRKHFILVKISKKKGCDYLSPVPNHGSADVLALSRANGFMVANEDVRMLKKGTTVRFITWDRTI